MAAAGWIYCDLLACDPVEPRSCAAGEAEHDDQCSELREEPAEMYEETRKSKKSSYPSLYRLVIIRNGSDP